MMNQSSAEYFNALHAVALHTRTLMRDVNVVGVGVGSKTVDGEDTNRPCVAIMVARKYRKSRMPVSLAVPSLFDIGGGRMVPTDVVETGHFFQHSNTARVRPASPGASLGNIRITAGTFGAVVVDDLTSEELILSNNHVLADNNRAARGSSIVQPGRIDGGADPGDRLATLTRFIELVPEDRGTNLIDAAVAKPVNGSDLSNEPLNGVPAPSAAYPAVGLLWGGSDARSLYSPISTVLNLLGVSLPVARALTEPVHGLELQKTGRTTERTTGRITELGATIRVVVDGLGAIILRDQFTTTVMSEGGDSGSVAVTKDRVA